MGVSLVIVFIVVIFLLALGLFSAYLCWRALRPRAIPLLKTYQIEVEHGRLDERAYRAWPKEEVKIRSPLGYYLAATYFPLPDAKRTLIFAHGHGYSRFGGVKVVPFFHRLGFNVLLFDQRGHGLSGGKTCTYGYYERHDLKALATWALERLGPTGQVGTMGESLGAATCLLHAAIDSRVAFVIADSPYARLEDVFKQRLREDYRLPEIPFYYTTTWLCRLMAGFSPQQIAPIEVMPLIQAPVLLIHGSADALIPVEAALELHRAAPQGKCVLYLAEGAEHVAAHALNPVAYFDQIAAFLRMFNLIEPEVETAPPAVTSTSSRRRRRASRATTTGATTPSAFESPHPPPAKREEEHPMPDDVTSLATSPSGAKEKEETPAVAHRKRGRPSKTASNVSETS
ncbi:alpha/beta hydrolase [uncultured Thermanaerothrix sp.]|uniref:alpha/beta hydrolase n=1 Tax=uncultured Thermanaerothrix sp. TaxID=1195149 RepID=UPI0026252D81|nr:alpha/beta hydrolase [uncultured Thermanaerothrix sp.]